MSNTDSDYQHREQSEIKHFALQKYLEAAARILGPSKHLKYIDCCAGPWNSRNADRSDTSFGIAVKILKDAAADLAKRNISPKFGCLLIEKVKATFHELEQFSIAANSLEVTVEARNWDFSEELQAIVEYGSKSRNFPFIFIDPTGWKLAGISKIRPLLKLNPGEVLINLMSPFIGRFVKDGTSDFTDLLGEDFTDLRGLSGAELEFEVIRKYSELVRREGSYKYVCALPVMNPDLDQFNFFLIYATRDPKGIEVFKSVEKRTQEKTHDIRADVQQRDRQERSGNLELFSSNVQYHETRYTQLTRANQERAKASVWQMIASAKTVSYDECWAEALQLSAVYEKDLREWIQEWTTQGLVVVHGMSGKSRVLRRNSGHTISILKNTEP